MSGNCPACDGTLYSSNPFGLTGKQCGLCGGFWMPGIGPSSAYLVHGDRRYGRSAVVRLEDSVLHGTWLSADELDAVLDVVVEERGDGPDKVMHVGLSFFGRWVDRLDRSA